MQAVGRLVTLIAIVSLMACSQAPPPPAAAPAVDTAAEQKAISALGDRYVELFNAKDAAGLAAMYTADALRMVPGQPTNKGTDAIRAAIQQGFTDGSTKLAVQADETVIAENGRAAVSHGTYTLEIAPPKGKPVTATGAYMNVLTKGDGGWKVARSLVAPTPPAPPAR